MAPAEHARDPGPYYFPHGSWLPLFGAISLFTLMAGAAATLNGADFGAWVLGAGFVLLGTLFFLWFGAVIRENQAGLYNEQVDRSFRMGMMWFIFSEVMFFAGLIGTYIVLRVSNPVQFSPDFLELHYHKLNQGLAGVNTLVLILSSLTMVLAVQAGKQGKAGLMQAHLLITALLGTAFCVIKYVEYGSKFEAGIYPDTQLFFSCYFVTTGIHLAHVILGVLPLLACFFIALKSDKFLRKGDETIELLGLYWHFVDLVWIFLFPLLYLIR
jgi:cytochrome c oxidase subunit 3